MKCLKRLSNFSKFAVIGVLLLLLALPSLVAIPPFLTGSETGKLIAQLQDTTAVQESTIAEKDLLIAQQKAQLEAWLTDSENSESNTIILEKQIMELLKEVKLSQEESESYKLLVENMKRDLEALLLKSTDSSEADPVLKERLLQMEAEQASLRTLLQDSELTTEKLQAEIEATKVLLDLTDVEYTDLLENDLIPLQEAYDDAIAELEQTSFTGMFGIDGVLYSDGTFGAGINAGIGWGNTMLTFGADIPITFDTTKITYRAGLQFRF